MTDFVRTSDIAEIVKRLGNTAQKFSGRTVLLTGGQGFLGRYFTEIFSLLNKDVLDQPATVVVLDNLITSGKGDSKIPERENFSFINLVVF